MTHPPPPPTKPSALVRSPAGWVVRQVLKVRHAGAVPTSFKSLDDRRRSLEDYAQRVVGFHEWEGPSTQHYHHQGNAAPLDRLSHSIYAFADHLPDYGNGQASEDEHAGSVRWQRQWLGTLERVATACQIIQATANAKFLDPNRSQALARVVLHVLNPANSAQALTNPTTAFELQVMDLLERCLAHCQDPHLASEPRMATLLALEGYRRKVRAHHLDASLTNLEHPTAAQQPPAARPKPRL